MVAAIRQQVTIQPGGVIEIRSPELPVGARAEVIVVLESAPARKSGADWRSFAGAINSANPQASENDQIDADLADAYGATNKPGR